MKRIVKTPFPLDPFVSDAKTIGAAIRAVRTESGLSLEDAALATCVAKQTLSDLEAGLPSVGLGITLRIANALGLSLLVIPTKDRETVRRRIGTDVPDAN